MYIEMDVIQDGRVLYLISIILTLEFSMQGIFQSLLDKGTIYPERSSARKLRQDLYSGVLLSWDMQYLWNFELC